MKLADVKCYACGAIPSVTGYLTIPCTCYCERCALIKHIHSSVDDASTSIRNTTSLTQLQAALDWERTHARRATLIKVLERQIRKVSSTIECSDV